MIGKAVSFIKRFLNKKDRRQETIADFHTTIIRVDDNFISSSSVMLDEPLLGNIFSLKEVIVAQTAQVSGNITSRNSTINGSVYGDILSIDHAEIKATAVITGNIRAKSISIEAGCVINGSVRIEGEIDDGDLIEKVQNRLPAGVLKKPSLISYTLSEPDVTKDELIVKGGANNARTSESNKRASLPAIKNKPASPVDPEEKAKDPTTSWY